MFLSVLLFLWLPQIEGKGHPVMCTRTDPFQIPHDYYKTGDLIIGAIVNLYGCMFDEVFFSENPNSVNVNEFL